MTTLVLLHAFPLSSWMYGPLRSELAGLPVRTPDLPGFGAAAPLGGSEPSLGAYAEAVDAVVCGIDDAVVLGGTSMGGYVTLAYASAYAERLDDRVVGLALLDTKATADPEAARANRLRQAAELESGGPQVLLAEVAPKLLGEETAAAEPRLVEQVRAQVAAAPPAAAAYALRAMAGRSETLDTLRALNGLPALVLRGADDVLSTAADVEAMAGALGCPVTTVPGAGHLAALEQPAAVAAALRGLLTSLA
jgi:pimeloyl-ACP methyl ester carboxylesterase